MKGRTPQRATTWVVVALVLAVGWAAMAYVRAQATSPETLRAFPDDCELVVTVDLMRARQALAEVDWAIEKLLGTEIDETLALNWLQGLLTGSDGLRAEASLIDLRSDILPWIGRDISIGVNCDPEIMLAAFEIDEAFVTEGVAPTVPGFEGALNYAMCVVSCRDAGRAETFLDKIENLLSTEGLQPVSVTIADHEWICVGLDEFIGLVGIAEGQLIAFLAPLPKVVPSIERIVGVLRSREGSIASRADYIRMSEEVGEGSVFSLLVSATLDSVPVQTEVEDTVEHEIRSSSLVRVLVDSGGIRVRSVDLLSDDELLAEAGVTRFVLDPLVLSDTSAAVPDCVVGFAQFGSMGEYWSTIRLVLDSLPLALEEAAGTGEERPDCTTEDELWATDDLRSFAGEDMVVPQEVLVFIDALTQHFVGDTHIALTGDSKAPMLVATSRVRDGELLVSYLEMLATQSVPGLRVNFSDHGGELVKTMWVRDEQGYLPVVSYCLADEMLIVSNLEPAVRLTIDTIRGIMPSVERTPAIIHLREQMGEGGLFLFNIDIGALVQFVHPLTIELTTEEAEPISVIEQVFERISGHMKVKDDIVSSEFEIRLKAAPGRDTVVSVEGAEE